MIGTGVSIGVASRQSGVKVPTIRYYEEIGLVPKLPRTKSRRRRYGVPDVRRLIFIRHARELGLVIDDIRALLALQDNPEQSCLAADAIVRARLAEVERHMRVLRKLKTELQRMIAECSPGRIAECRVIEAIANTR
jgi:DNA-binding transcriptional MerR regulator